MEKPKLTNFVDKIWACSIPILIISALIAFYSRSKRIVIITTAIMIVATMVILICGGYSIVQSIRSKENDEHE